MRTLTKKYKLQTHREKTAAEEQNNRLKNQWKRARTADSIMKTKESAQVIGNQTIREMKRKSKEKRQESIPDLSDTIKQMNEWIMGIPEEGRKKQKAFLKKWWSNISQILKGIWTSRITKPKERQARSTRRLYSLRCIVTNLPKVKDKDNVESSKKGMTRAMQRSLHEASDRFLTET